MSVNPPDNQNYLNTGYAPYSVFSISNWILKNSATPMTQMKLLKLSYLAQALHLGVTGNPFFREEIEAWKYGPVIPTLYHYYKKYGKNDIPPDDLIPNQPEITDEDDMAILNFVLSRYGNKSAFDLSSMTHQPGTPWDTVWNRYGGSEYKGATITDETILSYYRP